MGIFDFVKEVGEKLGLGKGDGKEKQKERAAVEEYVEESTRANRLYHHVKELGIGIEDLRVEFDDGTATLHGRAASQAEKEKAILAVGNTEGVARVDDRLEVGAAEPEAAFYTVERGDTLSKIAKEHYGNANEYPRIFEANRPMLKDPDKIYPGQVLRIPAREG